MSTALLTTVFWTACVGPDVEPSDSPMVPAALLAALQEEKFQGLPDALLRDRATLARQLTRVIEKPPGDTPEATRFIRRRAVIALGMYGGMNAVPTLRKLTEDKTEPFRRDAVLGLGRTKTKEGVALAAKFLQHEDELFRESAIDALGASGRAEALQALKEFDASKEKAFIQRKRQQAIDQLRAAVSPKPDK